MLQFWALRPIFEVIFFPIKLENTYLAYLTDYQPFFSLFLTYLTFPIFCYIAPDISPDPEILWLTNLHRLAM